jgi:hypothetical protein
MVVPPNILILKRKPRLIKELKSQAQLFGEMLNKNLVDKY